MEALDVTQVRIIFNHSQHLHKHQRCLKQMNELFEQCVSHEELINQFKTELRRCVLFTLKEEPKSPFVKHTIEFVAKFLRIFSAPEEAKDKKNTSGDTTIIDEEMAAELGIDISDQENRQPIDEESFDELGMETLGSESFSRSKRLSIASDVNTSVRSEAVQQSTFSDIVIKEQLIPFLYNANSKIRLNCCILVRKVLMDIEDVDLNVYNKLKKALRDLTRDKDKAIRSAAALSLQRFQEVDDEHDPVSDALRFHLKCDPDFRVRQSCLISLHPTVANIEHFVDATRDVKEIVRKTAFIMIADKYEVKNFGIESRLTILRNGINERHPAVNKVVQLKLLPNWVKSYSGDLVQFLYGLDLQSDPNLVQRTLYMYFDYLIGNSKDDTEDTDFHKYLYEFKNRFLSDKNFLTKEDLTVENSFLWRIVAKYCREKDINVKIVTDVEEEMVESDSQQTEKRNVETVEAIDIVIPDLPHYCNYLKVFIRQLLANDFNETDLLEFQFMFGQLLQMGELIEIGDEAQRQILTETVENLLLNDQLFHRIHEFIGYLMKVFSKNADLNTLVSTTLETIDTINSRAIEAECASQPPPPPPPKPKETEKPQNIDEQIRKLELEYAKLSVRIENLKDDLESAKNDGNEEEAQKLEELIASLTARMNEVYSKRLNILAAPAKEPEPAPASQISSQMDNRSQKTLTDDPFVLERCLEILSGCLEFGNFKTVHPAILTLMERLVMPSIANTDYFRIRNLAVKILGLICLIGIDLARRNFFIIIQVYQLDSCLEVRETAMKCIFDILCAHGFSNFEQKAYNKQKQNKSVSQDKTLRGKSQTDIDMESDVEDMEKTVINNENIEVLCSDSEVEDDDDVDTLVSYFTGVMEDNLKSECDSLKLTTAQGVAKLFVLGRMFSPQLLSKLLILWYDPDTSEEMKQFLGGFLPIYANVQMKPNLRGENAFEECFIKTVETVFDEGLNFVNLDNMINFVLELISDDGHKNLAKSVANQILTRMLANGVDDYLSNKYYLRVLAVLRLNEMTLLDIKEYKLLIKKVEKKLSKLKLKPKVTTNRLQTIKAKIEKQVELIRQNANQTANIEEFGSLSLSESLSQSLTERSQVDDTILESSPTKN